MNGAEAQRVGAPATAQQFSVSGIAVDDVFSSGMVTLGADVANASVTRQASYQFADIRQPVWKWVASTVALMRPAITVYLMALVTLLVGRALFGAPLPYVDGPAMIREVVTTVVYFASTAVTWCSATARRSEDSIHPRRFQGTSSQSRMRLFMTLS